MVYDDISSLYRTSLSNATGKISCPADSRRLDPISKARGLRRRFAHGGHARSQSAHQVRPRRTFGQARPGTHNPMLALRVALRNLGFRPVLTAVTLALLGLAVAHGTVVVLLARAFEAGLVRASRP